MAVIQEGHGVTMSTRYLLHPIEPWYKDRREAVRLLCDCCLLRCHLGYFLEEREYKKRRRKKKKWRRKVLCFFAWKGL